MAPTGSNEITWRPTSDVVERARITRFMRAHGIGSLAELQRRSVEDPEWYWSVVARDLGIHWMRPPTRVLHDSRGPAWPQWFPGGLLNLADNCVDRHLDAGRGDRLALIWEGDDRQVRTLTYQKLAREVARLANALRRLAIAEGDRVGIFLPMSPEEVNAAGGIKKLRVVTRDVLHTPVFLELAGADADGVFVTTAFTKDSNNPKAVKLTEGLLRFFQKSEAIALLTRPILRRSVRSNVRARTRRWPKIPLDTFFSSDVE